MRNIFLIVLFLLLLTGCGGSSGGGGSSANVTGPDIEQITGISPNVIDTQSTQPVSIKVSGTFTNYKNWWYGMWVNTTKGGAIGGDVIGGSNPYITYSCTYNTLTINISNPSLVGFTTGIFDLVISSEIDPSNNIVINSPITPADQITFK